MHLAKCGEGNPWGASLFSKLTIDPAITILASASPRRMEILKNLGVKFTVLPSAFSEDLPRNMGENSHISYVCETAKQKALDVLHRGTSAGLIIGARFIIAADTIVYDPETDQIFEKPLSREHAATMLKQLSGRKHIIYSAITIVCLDAHGRVKDILSDFDSTTSEFDHLEDDFIDAYTKYSDETLDKAGACAESGLLSVFIKNMEGSFYTAMGFPVGIFYKLITNYLMANENKD